MTAPARAAALAGRIDGSAAIAGHGAIIASLLLVAPDVTAGPFVHPLGLVIAAITPDAATAARG